MEEFTPFQGPGLPQNPPPIPPESACPKCGSIAVHRLQPAPAPHAWALHCAFCHKWIKWYSTRTPAERAARREIARGQHLKHRPPSQKQLDYLSHLGFVGVVSSCLSASVAIDALLHGRVSI